MDQSRRTSFMSEISSLLTKATELCSHRCMTGCEAQLSALKSSLETKAHKYGLSDSDEGKEIDAVVDLDNSVFLSKCMLSNPFIQKCIWSKR